MQIRKKLKRFVKHNKILMISLSVLIIVLAYFIYQRENPNSQNGMIRTAQNYEKQGKLATAINTYNQVVRKYPQNYDGHYHLGLLLLQVQEPEKAKIEFFRAINLGIANRYEANFAMANIYESENNYTFAEQLIKSFEVTNAPNSAKEKVGRFYLDWGKKTYYEDKVNSLAKYKLAFKYLSEAHSPTLKSVKKELEKNYETIANSLIQDKKEDTAIKVLNDSIKLFNNANAHYKLAEIYEYHDIDKCINEYEKAFEINPSVGNRDKFARLLLSEANALTQKGDTVKADIFTKKAISYSNPSNKITNLPNQNIILNLISTRSYKDESKNALMPGITFNIMNNSKKEEIKYLKAKIVFWADNSINDKVVQDILPNNSILKPEQSTKDINIFSTMQIKDMFADHNIKIQIYLSQTQPDSWKLYRDTYIRNLKKVF